MMLKQIGSEIRWCLYRAGCKLKSRARRIERLFHAPSLPKNPDGRVCIHLGCGDVNSPEFINVDARRAAHVHYIRDVTDLTVFSDSYADLIYACHVLEHIRHAVLKNTLWEWRRVLKPGGILRLSVPDFDKMVHIYEACGRDMESVLAPLMGGQSYSHNVHCCAFNQTYLAGKLKEAGFTQVRPWDPDRVSHHDFTDWANMELETHGQAFPISLNLEAVK